MPEATKNPCGIVAVLVGADGHHIAHGADFDRGRPAGFSTRDSQEMRARRALALAAIEALASPRLCKVLNSYECERILGMLVHQGGCKVHIIEVGEQDA